MTSVRRALVLSLAERYALIAISLTGNILIARLLTPEQIGIYSVILAVIGIAQVMRDFGIGNFLVQVQALTDEHIRTSLGISLIIGISLFSLLTLAAPAIGEFYADERVAATMRICAINFLVLPFCSISLALLRRDMKFNRIVPINLVAALAGFSTTITLAYAGFGPDSMAIGSIVSNVTTGIGAWLARSDRKFLLPGLSEWRSILSFGGQSTVSSIVTTIAIDANDLVVGKVLGFAPVAMLSRAQGLMNLFHRDLMNAVRGVAFPAFAEAFRAGQSVEQRHITTVTAITVFAWPFYGFMSLYALEVLRLLFGTQWDPARELVPVFCIAGAFSALNAMIPSLMISVGRVDLVMRADLILQPARLALITTAAIVFKSLLACALAYLLITAVAVPVFYAFKSRCVPTEKALFIENMKKSGLVTFITLLFPLLFALHAGLNRLEPLSLLSFIAIGIICLVSWLFAIIVIDHPIYRDPIAQNIVQRINKTLRFKILPWR